ncbi:polysaccharide biosynthesis protein [Lapidilactobacillus gannanensis]|uniref:Polysaccharide biosynthesis protein n=1 Tax=Lapidilactobacillus gannanensis TaxID=2486002 RepID=A0ABW4BNJ9_9LACO|nr:nucleoside-diphosphate sugar epimerase/dehydratase [Lapidilactobacillus gannanensis]
MNRRTKKLVLMLVDVILVVLANEMAFFFVDRYVSLSGIYFVLTIISEAGLYLIIANSVRVFSKINRYTSIKEVSSIALAVTAAYLVTLIGLIVFRTGFSARHFVLTYLFALLFIAGSRLTWRYYVEFLMHRNGLKNGRLIPTLLVGAGDGASVLLNRLSYDQPDVNVVGLVDDDADKQGTWIHGVKVLGTLKDLPNLIKQNEIEQVTIAIPSLPAAGYDQLMTALRETKVTINRMPKLDDILSDKSNAGQLQDINVADLLERPEVRLDMSQISDRITKKVILVTGAGGSIGSEIVRQVSKFSPKQVLLLGHGENSIYMITREMRKRYPDDHIKFVPLIGDIQDRQLMFDLMAEYKPDIVYHAAAHKHVPLMEYNPHEAIKNNVFGTKNVADAAKAANVTTFVMISTDKAVNSSSVMGSTKRMAEMIVTGENEPGKTHFAVVRFGNVLGSRGSVIPLFERQIKAGGPLTLTDKRMTRYFMTIPEASRLVIQAGALAKGGELFILDMGQPVRILDLAKNVIRLSGHTEAEIGIKEVGMRPGEKLYEELVTDAEKTNKKVYDKISLGHVSHYNIEDIINVAQHLLTLDDDSLSTEIVEYSNQHNGQEKTRTE